MLQISYIFWFWTKLFSCIIAKRAGFDDLVMSSFATRFKHRQHSENITDDDEFPILFFNYPWLSVEPTFQITLTTSNQRWKKIKNKNWIKRSFHDTASLIMSVIYGHSMSDSHCNLKQKCLV